MADKVRKLKDAEVVSLKDVPVKKPRGYKQYDPAKDFPGVKVFQKEGVEEVEQTEVNALCQELAALTTADEAEVFANHLDEQNTDAFMLAQGPRAFGPDADEFTEWDDKIHHE